MQVFRLVETGRPDRLIAFDELPKRLVDGLEMRPPDGLPRHWRTFIGGHERYLPGSLEKNPVTGKVEMVGEERLIAPFFYVLYYKEINKDKERWAEICGFVRRVVSLQFRLMDNIADMSIPMAPDSASEMKVEPEDLEENGAIIPIPVEFQEKNPAILDANGNEVRSEPTEPGTPFKCDICGKALKNEQALKMHKFRKHRNSSAEKAQEEPAAV